MKFLIIKFVFIRRKTTYTAANSDGYETSDNETDAEENNVNCGNIFIDKNDVSYNSSDEESCQGGGQRRRKGQKNTTVRTRERIMKRINCPETKLVVLTTTSDCTFIYDVMKL